MPLIEVNYVEDVSNVEFVIYCRKSTDWNNRQAQSIPDQIKYCLDFAKRSNLKIKEKPEDFSDFETLKELSEEANDENADVYKEAERYFIIRERKSAKTPWDRPKWSKLIKLVKQGKVKWIISYSPDRQSRNLVEGGEIVDLAEERLVSLKYANFHFTNNASGRMMLWVWFVISKNYSDKLSEDVQRGTYTALENHKALGYKKYGYKINDLGIQIPDPETFDIMKEAFRMKIYDRLSDEKIALYLKSRWVKKVSKVSWDETYPTDKTLGGVWRDTFYYGIHTYWNSRTSLIGNGYFEPMITEEEGMILYQRSKEWKNEINGRWADIDSLEYYPLEKGSVTAPDWTIFTCTLPNPWRFKKKLIEAQKTNPNTTISDVIEPKQLIFVIANKESKYYKKLPSVNFADIQTAILSELKKMTIKQDAYEQYLTFMKSGAEAKMNEIDEEKNILEARKMTNDRLYNKFVKNNLWKERGKKEEEVYQKEKKNYENIDFQLETDIKNLSNQKRNKILEFEVLVNLLKNAYLHYENTTYVQKREFAKILGLNIKISPQKKLKIDFAEGIRELIFNNGGPTWTWTRDQSVMSRLL